MEDDQKNSKWKTTKKIQIGKKLEMEDDQQKIKMEDDQNNHNGRRPKNKNGR